MNLSERIEAMTSLGEQLQEFVKEIKTSELVDAKYGKLSAAVEQSFYRNGWFTKPEVLRSLEGIILFLNEKELRAWTENYADEFQSSSLRTIGIVMAGNIPLVGFHDFLSAFIAGFKVQIKLASDDKFLLPALLQLLETKNPKVSNQYSLVERLVGYHAVIATGSNNTARYFETYFSKVPNIIRKNRTSVAVLSGEESKLELENLAGDIFQYYGLGCRNVTKVYIPENFDTDRLFEAFMKYKEVAENKKYMNNYMYHQTLFLMNDDKILDNGFVVLKEDERLHSPLGVLFVERYSNIHKLEEDLTKLKEQIQCIVGKGSLELGSAQRPTLVDYADNVNTLDFLSQLERI